MIQEDELIRRAKRLIKRYDDMRIVGGGGEWSGSARQGFAFNPKPLAGGGTGTGPIIPTGACCIDGECSILTQANCIAAGGDYQGDGTDCDPNPCPPEGACCVGTDCTIETEDDCTGMGGTYQGDDTTCDPNPCEMVDCSCGFEAFDGSGRRFLRMDATCTIPAVDPDCCHTPGACPGPFFGIICDTDQPCSGFQEYDPLDCSLIEFIVPGTKTVYHCDCTTTMEDCSPFGCCTGGCSDPGCSCTATEYSCTIGNMTCTRTLSEECNPI